VRRTARIASVVVVVFVTLLMLPPPADAGQRGRVVIGAGYGYAPYYYRPVFYDPFAWGAYGWYPAPWGPWGPYRPYPRAWGYDPAAHVRIQSTPAEAQVYVDGYFVGIVDDFNGWSQRLRLPPGEYEIQLYLEGYRTVSERLLLRPGQTYRIRRDLERLAPGDPEEQRPEPTARSAAAPAGPQQGPPTGAYGPPPDRQAPPRAARARGEFGTIAVRVRPADAEIFVNGERWDRPAGEDRLTVDVAAGTHTIEVRREGYTTYTAQVDVRSGRVTSVNVSLPEQ
jgi:hypothetical protein